MLFRYGSTLTDTIALAAAINSKNWSAAAVSAQAWMADMGWDITTLLSQISAQYGASVMAQVQAALANLPKAVPGDWDGNAANQKVSDTQRLSVLEPSWYMSMNPDVSKAGLDAPTHWLTYGINEGRQSSPTFDIRAYLTRYPELAATFGADFYQALNHYFLFGISEGKTANPITTPPGTKPPGTTTTDNSMAYLLLIGAAAYLLMTKKG